MIVSRSDRFLERQSATWKALDARIKQRAENPRHSSILESFESLGSDLVSSLKPLKLGLIPITHCLSFVVLLCSGVGGVLFKAFDLSPLP
jgi:hypothetical protein